MDRRQNLATAFANDFLTGARFANIVEARSRAAEILAQPIQPGTELAKFVDESVERGLIRAAKVIASFGAPEQIYDRLVGLYRSQPTLGTRSSTSIAQQAYSTPLPIAYLAAQMAGINPKTTVYEPTAGNGSLLLTVEPSQGIANELNPERAAELRVQGYDVTESDAIEYLPAQQVDVILMNPPFGSVRLDNGTVKEFEIPAAGIDSRTFVSSQVDHAIALNSLRAMKQNGRAVLILGGMLGDERSRSRRYNSQLNRNFYYTLYSQYKVTRHISIDGSLYSRQGASFPIDLILIQGRGKSRLNLPAAELPRIYRSFDELKELLPRAIVSRHQQSLDALHDRINNSSFNSSASTPNPDRNLELQSIPGLAGNEDRMDDSAGNRSRQSTERDRKLYSVGGNVLPSLSPTPTGQPAAVGDRLDSREPALSRTTDLSLGNNISSTSHSRSSSFGYRRAYQLRGMVATDGSWNERRLDITADLDTTGEEMKDMAEEHTTQSPKQVPYIPASKAAPGNTLVPVNMQAGIAKALSRLEKQVGVIDEYVTERLNYGSVERLHQYFNAEQVDAIALAINNLEKGRACILGDQTGVGKGRVVAAAIRYARETGRIPIFVTKDPVLYADLYRDLSDIRMGGFRAFPTNSNLKISLPDGRELKTSGDSHEREMQAFSRSGDLGNYQAVFTTYSQMQSVKGKETERRNFLRAIAPRSIVILDESHEAGGSGEKKPDTVPDRAKFVRELLSLSQGGFYSSATFAKRPNVMDLYALTDMGKAVSTEKLVGLVERGGIPMVKAF